MEKTPLQPSAPEFNGTKCTMDAEFSDYQQLISDPPIRKE